MSVGADNPPNRQASTCCICAQSSTAGTRDKKNRFVCADCLERARQAILDRRVREARAKSNAKLEAEVAKAEADNSEVLQWRSALDPALALLCPNCGRILHLDVGACHACGYGVVDQRPHRRFSLFGRARGARPPVAAHLLELNASWLNSLEPRAESFLPLVLAVPLWTMTILAIRRHAALVSADILVVVTLSMLACWFLGELWRRSPRASVFCAIPPLAALVVSIVNPFSTSPGGRWVLLAALLAVTSVVTLVRVRGSFVALWLVAALPGFALIVLHAVR